jgi:hypothetical protein
MNILRQYRNKAITRKTAVALVTKFLLQEGVLFKFLDDIKKIKPYKKGDLSKSPLIYWFTDL